MGSSKAAWWLRLGALVIVSFATPAWAQTEADRTTARELAYEGQEAFDRGDYTTAVDRFSRADALVHAPTLALALARAQLKLGRVVQAYENYNRILREGVAPGSPAVFQQAYDDAEREVGQVRAKLAWVTLILKGPSEAEVTLDRTQPVPRAAWGVKRAIDPGQHVVRASAAGHLPVERTFQLGEGQTTEVELRLERDPNAFAGGAAQPPSSGAGPVASPAAAPAPGPEHADTGATQRTLGYVALGVGGAGVIIGSITGILAIGKHGTLKDECRGGQCPLDEQETLDSYRTLGGISTAAFVVGAAGTIASITLLLTAPEPAPARARLELRVRGPGLLLNGAF